jgi:drug/metabolite transporter (DMT)-like permease
MSRPAIFWTCLAVYTVIDAAGTYYAAKWSKGELSPRYFCASLFFYAACSVCWLVACRHEDIGRGSVLYPLVAMIVGVGAGLLAEEKFSALHWAGVGLGVVSIILVSVR